MALDIASSARYDERVADTDQLTERGCMKNDHCEQGLDDRCRDLDGELRRKRSDTLVGTLREHYGESFAPGVRSDMKLGTLLDRADAESLSDYLKHSGNRRGRGK